MRRYPFACSTVLDLSDTKCSENALQLRRRRCGCCGKKSSLQAVPKPSGAEQSVPGSHQAQKGDLHSIEQISERMLSTPTESSVEFMVAELDDALQSLMFRWNICYERYSSFRLSDNEKKKISLIIQSGIDFLQKKKEVPL